MAWGGGGPAGRLAVALAVSALLHVWLLGGVSVHRPPTVPTTGSELRATLEAGAEYGHREAATAPTLRPSLPPRLLPAPEPVAEPDVTAPLAASVPIPSLTDVQHEPPDLPAPDVRDPKPALDVPAITDTTVYPAHELDVFPLPRSPVSPSYPSAARQAKVAGHATVELVIDEEGVVREARLVDASPSGYFEEAALESFRAVRFHPAQRDGRAARARIAIRLDFAPPRVPSDPVQ